MGTWTVNSTQKYSIDSNGDGTVIEEADTFTVNITASPNSPDEVFIDGLSVLGQGWAIYGAVDGDRLHILNGTDFGYDESGYIRYYWLSFYDVGIYSSIMPFNILTKNGVDSAISTNKLTLYDTNNNPVAVECYCSDVFGVDDDGTVYFLIEDFPAVYRTGDMTWTKTNATPSTLSKSISKSRGLSILPSSMVVAM